MKYTSQPHVFYKVKNGTNGSNGSDGKGIKSHTITYQASSSGTTVPTGTWASTIPSVSASQYLWTRTVITYTDDTTSTSYSIGMMGATGGTGSTGTGVESIATEYYLSTSKTAQSGGTWQTTMPSWSYGKYLWIRSKVVYKNPTSTAYTTPYCDSSWEAVKNVEADILAWCYNNDKTYINGSKIYARSITSSQLSTDAIKSINYVSGSAGSFLNLSDGSFDSKYFKWTKEGVITATSGTIAGIKIDTTKLTAGSTSGSMTRGYEITNTGYISIYNRGSGRDYNMYLNAEHIRIESYGTNSGSIPKEAYLEDLALTFKSEGTTTGYIHANNGSLDLYGISGINAKSNFYATNVPSAGIIEYYPNLTEWMQNNKSFIGTAYDGNTWYELISVRHRNGEGDGTMYGMYLSANLFGGDLYYQQQDANGWKEYKKILDSYNYSSYAISTSLGGTINNNSDEALVVTGGVTARVFKFNNNVKSFIQARTNGGFDFYFSQGGARIVFDGADGKIYRVSASGTWTTLTN